MSSFFATFSEPVTLSDGTVALAKQAFPDPGQAAATLGEYLDADVQPDALQTSWARFCFPPENADWDGDPREPAWFTGMAPKRGAQEVWVYPPRP